MSLEPAVDAESHNVSASSEDWSHGVDLDTSQGHHNEEDFTALPNHQSALVTYTPQSQQTVNTSADNGTSFIDNIGRTSLDCSLVDHPETVQEEAVSPVIHVPLVSGGLSEATLRNYCQAVNSSASIQDPLNSNAESPLAQSPQTVKSPVNPQLVYTLQTVNSPVRVCTPQTATPPVALQTVNSPVRPAVFHRPLTVISPVKCAVVRPQQNINSPLRSVLVCTPKTVNSPVRSPVFRTPQNINSPVRSSLVRSPQTINSPVRGTLVCTQQPLNSPVRSTLFSAPETPKTATVGTSQIISSTATGGTKTVVVTSPAKSSKISPEVIKSLSKTFCDGDLQTWMIYNIRSNHHNAPNGHTLALWNGTEFVEVPQAEKYINELNQNTPQICNTNGGIHIAAAEPKSKSIQIQQTPSASLGKRSASTLSVLKQLKTPSSPYPSVRLTSPTTQKQNGAVSNSNLVNTNSPVRPARGKNKQVQQTLVKGNRLPCPTVITKVVRNPADVLGVNSNSVTKAPGVTRIYVQSVPKSDGTCKPGTVTGNTPVIRNIPVQKQIIIQKSTPEPKPGVQQQTPEHKSVLPRHIPVERTVISVVPDTTSVQEQVPLPEPAQPEPEEKLAEDEFKVCKNCGNLSKNPRICEGCGKPCGKDRTFKKNLGQQMLFKSVPSVDKAPANPEVLTKQSFYGKKLEEQSKPYNQTFGVTKRSLRDIVRKRKPINSKRKAEPETVIISSDEEETNCDTPISATEESPTKGANSVHSEPSVTSTDCSSSNFTPSVASQNESTGIDSHRSTVGRVCNSSVAQLAGNQDNKVADTSQLSGSTTTTPDRKHSTQGLALSNPVLTASISRERRPNQETVQHTFPTLHQERMGTRRDRMEDADGNIPRKSRRQTRKTKVAADAEQQPFDKDKGTSVAMNVRCVRFGLLRGVPVEPVFFSREGIFIKMECEDKSQEVHIPPAEMENLAVHLNPRLPVMFINPSFNCGQRLRREIGCTQEQFAPGSEDLKTKFITLLFDHGTTEEERNFLDSLFMHYERIKPHQPKFLQILNHEEANNVLVQTSETRFPYQDSTLNTSASEENPAFDLGPHVAVEKLFIYRTPPEKGGITITTEDLYCLTEGEFLNDVIIDFYLKYLKAEVLSDEANERLYVFSSFFYKGLTQKLVRATGDKQVDLKVRRHENVKTWTRRVDLFSKDFIVIPINEHAHWFLAIICFPGMVPEKAGSTSNHNGKACSQEEAMDQSFDSNSMSTGETEEPEQPPSHNKPCHKQPCILVFDSLAGPARTSIVKTLRDYLSVEWSVKKQTERQFDRVTMKGGYPKVPQQNNCSDCGIYLLQYVESFFESPIEDFSLPIKGLQNWFTDERVGRKRVEIRDLILSMREKYAIEQTKSAS